MRLRLVTGLFGLAVAGSIAVSSAGAPARTTGARTTVFRHVAVLPMDRDVLLPDRIVIVRGDRIEAVRPDRPGPAPVRGTEIDGRGAVLMPGLTDFHTHAEGWEELPSFVSAGITTIATLDGETLTGRWREGGDLPRPNQIAGSEIVDGNPLTNRRFYAADAAHAGQIVDQELARGAQFLKIYGKLNEPARSAVLAAARARGMLVGGHTPRGADLRALFAQGFALVAHGEEYFQYIMPDPTDARIDAVADLTARAGAAVIPNLVAYRVMARQAAQLPAELAQADVALLSPAVYQEWLPRRNRYATRPNPQEFARRTDSLLPVLQHLTKSLFDRQVLLLAGTDAPTVCLPATCLREDIALLAASGIGNYQALRAATVNAGLMAGRMAHRPPAFGVVAPGMRADLLLLRADPRADLAALGAARGVMVAGRWWDAVALAAARSRVRAAIAPRHDLVDRYERLIVQPDLRPLFAFLAREVAPRSETLNANVMIFDALELEQAGRKQDAIRLLEHGAPVFRRAPGLLNVLGRLKAEAGDRAGARRAYEAARRLRPFDAVTLAGLSALDAAPGAR